MEEKKISIIVPAYNIQDYLGRCLDSLLNQTYKALEIIVVNDGSQDDTGAIIDAYAQKDRRIIAIHKKNGGVSSAREAGIAVAKGEYIGFVDGDDYVDSEMFENLLDNALKYNVDISHCGYQMIFPNGHIDYYYNTGRKELHNKMEGVGSLIEGKFVEPGLWNKLYRRELFEEFEKDEIWDSSICMNEDLLMNYILFSKAESSIYEDISFYHYILRKESAVMSNISRQKIMDPVRVMRKILDDTVSMPLLHALAAERYLRVLMRVAEQSHWKADAVDALEELKSRIKEFRKIEGVSKKVLLMAFCVAYLQPVYKGARRIYNLYTGVDKKYNLE